VLKKKDDEDKLAIGRLGGGSLLLRNYKGGYKKMDKNREKFFMRGGVNCWGLFG